MYVWYNFVNGFIAVLLFIYFNSTFPLSTQYKYVSNIRVFFFFFYLLTFDLILAYNIYLCYWIGYNLLTFFFFVCYYEHLRFMLSIYFRVECLINVWWQICFCDHILHTTTIESKSLKWYYINGRRTYYFIVLLLVKFTIVTLINVSQ